MKLYSVITTVKEYSGCKNVIFRWFRHAMLQGQRPYPDLIKDYEPRNRDAFYVEAYIEELFTWDEARQLEAYLDQHHGDQGDTVIKEVTLPVENNVMGFGGRAVGGGDSFYMLSEEPEYSLPFKVWGYFNLVGCTLIHNGDTYRHRLFIVREKDDGTIDARMESNPEAAARERRRDAIARDGDFSPF
jgi:hypothetical protein